MDPALRDAYLAAVYRVLAPGETIELAAGRPAIGLAPVVGGWPWALVTAWNPGSVPRPAEENREAQRRLEDEIAALDLRTLPTEASDARGAFREPGLLVIGIEPDAAVALARRHGQAAILAGRGPGTVQLVDCTI